MHPKDAPTLAPDAAADLSEATVLLLLRRTVVGMANGFALLLMYRFSALSAATTGGGDGVGVGGDDGG